MGLEPIHPKAEDFESSMSTIPSPRQKFVLELYRKNKKNQVIFVFLLKICYYLYSILENNFKKVILLSTDSLQGYWLHKIFLFAKEAWFHGIDLSVSFENYDSLDLEYLKKISDEIWIKILSISAPSSRITESLVDKIISMSSTFDSQVVTFCPPHFSDKNIDWYQKYLPKIKKSSWISISIKNMEPKFLFFIIPTRKNASLIEIKKITWDTSFDLSSSSDILKDSSFLWSSIKNIYLSDSLIEKKWLLLWTSVWWTSNTPIESFLMKLKANSYNWLFSLKVDPMELWAGNDEKVLTNLKYCISYYEKYFEEKN